MTHVPTVKNETVAPLIEHTELAVASIVNTGESAALDVAVTV